MRARDVFADLLESDDLVSHNYVVVETSALVQRRLGPRAVRALHSDLLGPVDVEWIDESLHESGVAALLAARGGALSLVDCVSFEVMRRRGIARAFAFDRDFVRHGFETVP